MQQRNWLNIVLRNRKTFRLLCIIEQINVQLFLFWNICTRLIHVNTSTPSLLAFNADETHAPSISWCFVLRSSAWFTICWWTNFPIFARTWIRLKGLGRSKLETCDFTIPQRQKLKEEAWVKFKINEMLFG